MSTDTKNQDRTADQVEHGRWCVRFLGIRQNSGTIARSNFRVVDVTSPVPGMDVLEDHITLTPGYTTLASAKKIIETTGRASSVIPVVAWRYDSNGIVTDEFEFI